MTSWPTSWIKARTGFCPTLMGEATYTVTHGWDRSIYGITSGIGNLLLKFEVARISEVLIVTGVYPWQHLSRSRGSLLPHRSPIGETKLLTTTALRPPKPAPDPVLFLQATCHSHKQNGSSLLFQHPVYMINLGKLWDSTLTWKVQLKVRRPFRIDFPQS
jgi:hypothetical protein